MKKLMNNDYRYVYMAPDALERMITERKGDDRDPAEILMDLEETDAELNFN